MERAGITEECSEKTRASLVAQMVKNLPAMQKTWVWSLGQEDTLEKGMATHSSILAWRIPWTEGPGRLQSIRSHQVGHDWSNLARTQARLWLFASPPHRRKLSSLASYNILEQAHQMSLSICCAKRWWDYKLFTHGSSAVQNTIPWLKGREGNRLD